MKLILNKRIKYYTKEMFKYINLVAVALFIIMTAILLKYKLVCEVDISGESLGCIENKNIVEDKIAKSKAQEGKENIAFVDVNVVPKYKWAFIDKKEKTNEEEILAKIDENTKITYKYYEVAINENKTSIVKTLEEAEKVIEDVNKKYGKNIKFTTSIKEVYSENQNEYDIKDITLAKNEVSKELEKIDDASVNGIYLAQKPVTGRITSRYGNRERIRSHSHTGLDIAAPYGTPIKAAADGKVIWSGYKGSYGNLIIVDCGNDVKIYYGHCSKLYAKVGQTVKAGDKIGAVGSTGNSTGNHLHFEIRVNGKTVNPQKYIYK